MKNWAYYITGDNPENLDGHSPESRRKVNILATTVLLPGLIWLGLGYSFGCSFLRLGFLGSICMGLLLGTVIFIVDRLIIMASRGNGWVTFTRFSLALVVSFLGTMIADHQIFQDDIRMTVSDLKKEKIETSSKEIDEQYKDKLASITSRLNDLEADSKELKTAYLNEADGTSGSGQRGIGAITKLKEEAWEVSDADAKKALSSKTELEAEIAALKLSEELRITNEFSDQAILTQVKAMFVFLHKNPEALVFWIPITLVLLILELLPLVIKNGLNETAYEMEVKYLEEVRKRRVELMKAEFEQQFNLNSQFSQSDRGAVSLLSNYQVNSIAS